MRQRPIDCGETPRVIHRYPAGVKGAGFVEAISIKTNQIATHPPEQNLIPQYRLKTPASLPNTSTWSTTIGR